MRVVIQRTEGAKITAQFGEEIKESGYTGKGLLIFVGIEDLDSESDVDYIVRKVINMRVFSDHQGKMNLSVKDINGSVGIVSQFTLHASTKKGNRPSFIRAAPPDKAEVLYDLFVAKISSLMGNQVICGVFGAMMKIELINDGPVTIIIDSKSKE
jgi:D-tyrosyl-tRNA(Tyr) deacylase